MECTGEASLILNKKYEVIDFNRDKDIFYIIDKDGDRHGFHVNDYQEFFKIK